MKTAHFFMEDEGGTAFANGVLVADAGSTKIDWAYISKEGTRFFKSPGVNPYFHDPDRIATLLKEGGLEVDHASVQRIHYYGAGCSSAGLKKRVEKGLEKLFPNASIGVEHDMLGAARASAGKEPSLVAILGTGSNACSYDGERISDQSGGLGYVLGDEGSGAHFGKLLLRDHLNGDLPEGIERAFVDRYPQDREEHIEAIYRGDAPSRYLAGFAPFMHEHLDHERIRGMVRCAFQEFIERHLLRFEAARGSVLHTVGSIGSYFRPVLHELLEEKGIVPGRSVLEPVHGLLAYHQGDEGGGSQTE